MMEQNLTRQRPPRPPPVYSTSRSSDSSLAGDVEDSFQCFRRLYDKTFANVDIALQLDESGNSEQAYDLYNKSYYMIVQALQFTVPSNHRRFNEMENMQEKLRRTKMQIESRCNVIRPASSTSNLSENHADTLTNDEISPPSYEQATSSLSSLTVGDEILEADMITSISSVPPNAQEIFSIPEGVQIYFITAEGYVSAPSYPSSLQVYRFTDDVDDGCSGEFLQIGQWYYPLVPGLSPVLHSDDNSYIFPDTTAPDSGCSVGIILPTSISQAQRREFERVLRSVTVMRSRTPSSLGARNEVTMDNDQSVEDMQDIEPIETESSAITDSEDRWSLKISRGIINVAGYVSQGIGYGAEKAGHYIKIGSNKLQQTLKPEETAAEIPNKYQNGLEKVRTASHVAVGVSSFVVKLLADATVKLGRTVAPHVVKHGEKIMPKTLTKKSSTGHSNLDGLVEVAGSSLTGFGTVYASLEAAAKAMARSIADETVDVVNYKYGVQAGKLAENSLYSAGNILMTGHNVQNLGIKAIAKRAAKDTGKAVIKDMSNDKKPAGPSTLPDDEKNGGSLGDRKDTNGGVC